MGTEEAIPRQQAMIGEMFRKVVDGIPVMLICYDGAANPVLVNGEFTRVLGWTLEDARKVDLMAECYPDPAYRKEVRACMAAAEPGWNDFRVRARDGRIVETSWANVHLSDGSHIAIGIDATERLRAEKEALADRLLRIGEEKALESRERYRELLEITSDWLWEVDRSGVYTYVGPGVRCLLGYEPDELLGKRPFDLMPADEAARVEKLFMSMIENGSPLHRIENVNRHKDGRLLTLETNGVPFFGPDNALQGYRGVDRDISDRVEAAVALRSSEGRYRSLFEGAGAVMLLIDPESGRIVDANPAAGGYYGFPCDRLRSMTILEINVLPPEEVFRDMDKARNGERGRFTFTHRLASGELRPVEVFSGPIRVHDRDLLFSIVHDIADRVRAEEALRESEERFRSLAERIPQPVFETGEDGRLTYMNLHGRNLFGYPEGELV
ncbi:MAG: PAS domain S-box protein, partial [Deltaproteobacteria bacterium]|nr:PAS domain S-box protein [Deltaproteobacteria bacterium]